LHSDISEENRDHSGDGREDDEEIANLQGMIHNSEELVESAAKYSNRKV